MFWQRWQCYILCWGKPRHSVPSLWASALSGRAPFDTSRSIKHTRSINKFVCTYENHNTTNRIMILHVTVQRRTPHHHQHHHRCRPARNHPASPAHCGVLMHLVYHRWHHETKFTSYGITIAICSQSVVLIGGKKQKHLMFVCTICCLGTESNV